MPRSALFGSAGGELQQQQQQQQQQQRDSSEFSLVKGKKGRMKLSMQDAKLGAPKMRSTGGGGGGRGGLLQEIKLGAALKKVVLNTL